MEVSRFIRNSHPEPGIWALKEQFREADQEPDDQFSYRNLTFLNSLQRPDTKESWSPMLWTHDQKYRITRHAKETVKRESSINY